MIRREEYPLAGMGALLVVGAALLGGAATDLTPAGVDAVLVAYALFVVGFLLGARYQYGRGNGVATAGHLVAVMGWVAGMAGRALGDVWLAAFSLAALGASGVALLYVGVDDVRASRPGPPLASYPESDEGDP